MAFANSRGGTVIVGVSDRRPRQIVGVVWSQDLAEQLRRPRGRPSLRYRSRSTIGWWATVRSPSSTSHRLSGMGPDQRWAPARPRRSYQPSAGRPRAAPLRARTGRRPGGGRAHRRLRPGRPSSGPPAPVHPVQARALAGRSRLDSPRPRSPHEERAASARGAPRVRPNAAGALPAVRHRDCPLRRLRRRRRPPSWPQRAGRSAPSLVAEADRRIYDEMRRDAVVRGLVREEVPEYPPVALREALVNAVGHRDYSLRGAAVEVRLYDDAVEVESPGTLAGYMTVDNLREAQYSRNERIMDALQRLGLVEEAGQGIDRMIAEMEDAFARSARVRGTLGLLRGAATRRQRFRRRGPTLGLPLRAARPERGMQRWRSSSRGVGGPSPTSSFGG